MAERSEPKLSQEAQRLERELAELRALRKRIDQNRLRDDDWAVVAGLISKLVDEAELGQEWVDLELPEDEEAPR